MNEIIAPLEPEGMGLGARLAAIFFSPTRVFEELRRQPRYWGPLLVMMGAAAVMGVVAMMSIDLEAQIVNATAAGGQIGSDELATAVKVAKVSGWVMGVLGAAIGTAVTYLVMALVFHGVGLLAGSQAVFRQTFSVVTHAFVVSLPSIALMAASMAARGEQMTSSPTSLAFLGPEGTWLAALLGQIEVFSIWAFILVALGMHVTGRLPVRRAALAVFVPWAVWVAAMATLIHKFAALVPGGGGS